MAYHTSTLMSPLGSKWSAKWCLGSNPYQSVIRLVGAVLAETHDEWQTSERRYLSEGSMNHIGQPPTEIITPYTPEFPAA